PGAIVDLGILVLGEQPLEDLPRQAMLTVRQIERAEQELGLDRMRRDLGPLERGREAHERAEMVLLIEMKQHLAVREIAHAGRLVPAARAGRRRREDQRRRDRGRGSSAESARGRHAYSHSSTTNSGWRRVSLSEIRSSMYFGPMPFSNVSVAPRR